MDLLGLLRKRGMDGDVDFLQGALGAPVEASMDAEVTAKIGVRYGERSPDRATHRNSASRTATLQPARDAPCLDASLDAPYPSRYRSTTLPQMMRCFSSSGTPWKCSSTIFQELGHVVSE